MYRIESSVASRLVHFSQGGVPSFLLLELIEDIATLESTWSWVETCRRKSIIIYNALLYFYFIMLLFIFLMLTEIDSYDSSNLANLAWYDITGTPT